MHACTFVNGALGGGEQGHSCGAHVRSDGSEAPDVGDLESDRQVEI